MRAQIGHTSHRRVHYEELRVPSIGAIKKKKMLESLSCFETL